MNICGVLRERAQASPDRLAIVDRSKAVTYRDLVNQVARGAALLTKTGVQPGQRVLMLARPSIDLFQALLSVFEAGAVAVFLDPSAGKAHVAAACDRAQPVAMIGSPGACLLRWTQPALRKIPTALVLGGWFPGAQRWAKRSRFAPANEPMVLKADAPALLTFTSGSTQKPKAAIRSHGFLIAQHQALAKAIALEEGQVDLTTLPIFVLANLGSGLTSVLPDADMRRPGHIDPAPVFKQIQTHRIERTAASPALIDRLIHHAQQTGQTLNLKRIDTGGAPVFPSLIKRLQTVAPQATCVAVYGSTEAEPISHQIWGELDAQDFQTIARGGGLPVGRPVDQVQLRILQDHTNQSIDTLDQTAFDQMTLPPETIGEIVVHGDHVLKGYLDGIGDEETKFSVDGQRWHRTGDAGRLDAQGRLWLLGRCVGRCGTDTSPLYPFAVEAAADVTGQVKRSALLEHHGQRILWIEPTSLERWQPDDLQDTLSWAQLDRIKTVDQIPMDARHNAKVDYTALKDLLADSTFDD